MPTYNVFRIVFYCYLVVSVYKADVTIDTVTIDTVCYGNPGLSCTTHQLSCTDGLVIDIINTTYGYRSGCSSAISNCNNVRCCSEQASDCFLPFDLNDTQRIKLECEGRQSCTSSGYRKVNAFCNGSMNSAYSRVEYVCIQGTGGSTQSVYITGTSDFTQSSYIIDTSTTGRTTESEGPDHADSDDTGAVVGGVIGVLVVVGVILDVGIFIYKRNRKEKADQNIYTSTMNVTSEQPDHHYDTLGGATTTSRNDTI